MKKVGWSSPKEESGGLAAILSAARHGLGKMGLVRTIKTLRAVNQQEGFDCPSCAWPDPTVPSAAEFCENGVKAVANAATRKRVTPEFFRRWSVVELGKQPDHWLNRQGRLTTPMVLHKGKDHYQPISWDTALRSVADHLRALSSPDRAVFYTSGRASNEAAFLFQLLARRFGTNNLPDCSNMCHESSGVALKETLGVGKGTVKLEDFSRADLILVIGQNPGTNHPRMLSTLEEAALRGAIIVHVNPLPEAGLSRFRNPQKLAAIVGKAVPLTRYFAQVRIGGDVAFLSAVMKQMLEAEENDPGNVLDRKFIHRYTQGFEELRSHLMSMSDERLVELSGVPSRVIEKIAQAIMRSDRIVACWAMGMTQHEHAVANIQSIVNLMLLKGCIGKPGAGVCPVRGHSNVQGDRTVGITSRPTIAFLEYLGNRFGFRPPLEPGLDTVDAIRAMHRGDIGVFLSLGGNFVSAAPDTTYTAEALSNCTLAAHVSTTLNRSHLTPGKESIILPCLARTERDVQRGRPQVLSVENSMGIVHGTTGVLEPASSDLRSEIWIVASLAARVLGEHSPWKHFAGDYDHIRSAIEEVIPGFDRYNELVRRPNGFALPNPACNRQFVTPSGKAQFTIHNPPSFRLDDGEYTMMTIRSHDQFNTEVYGLGDRYRGIKKGRNVIFLNPQDMKREGISAGQEVVITSLYDGESRSVQGFRAIPYPIPSRCAATYFPEANVLVPISHTASRSNTPASKSVVIRLD